MRKTTYDIFHKCPFWTGVEYNGMYECSRYHSICYGCDYNSKHWYRRLWFSISTDLEMWWKCGVEYQISKFKAYLFDKEDYYLFHTPYWWDIKGKRVRKERNKNAKIFN